MTHFKKCVMLFKIQGKHLQLISVKRLMLCCYNLQLIASPSKTLLNNKNIFK